LIALAALGSGTGCIHNHYYGTPVCGDPAHPGTVASYGSVCEVPTRIEGGTQLATGPGSQLVSANPRPSRVLISEPRGEGYPLITGGSRSGWRPGDNSSLATTRVEGAFEGDTVTK
jgi:hypothetical protein